MSPERDDEFEELPHVYEMEVSYNQYKFLCKIEYRPSSQNAICSYEIMGSNKIYANLKNTNAFSVSQLIVQSIWDMFVKEKLLLRFITFIPAKSDSNNVLNKFVTIFNFRKRKIRKFIFAKSIESLLSKKHIEYVILSNGDAIVIELLGRKKDNISL